MLTPYEKKRLEKLAQKAVIKMPKIPAPVVLLTRKEVRRIERALSESAGKAVLLVKKTASVRVYSPESHCKIGAGLRKRHAMKNAVEVI
jgi:hypothetical protein